MKTFIKSLSGVFCMTLIVMAGLFASCSDPSASLPEKPEMNGGMETIFFTSEGGSQTVTFETNRPWAATLIGNLDADEQPWCELSADSGEAGSGSVTVTVAALEGDYREAVLLLNASAAGREIRIMQSGQPVILVGEASGIDEANATLTAAWYYSGDIVVSEFGFMVAEAGGNADLYLVDEQSEDGAFTLRLEDLKPSTTYIYTAYVIAGETTYTGDECSFTTDAAPVRVSIAELKESGRKLSAGTQQTMTESQYIEGTVTSYSAGADADELSSITIQDATAADSGITLYFDGESAYSAGDKLSIRTKGGSLSHADNGRITFTALADGMSLTASGADIAAAAALHTELAKYESMVVKIDNTQLTKLFTDAAAYPTWGAAELWSMEVKDSEDSYSLQIPAGSELTSQKPLTGSGSITGLVTDNGEGGYAVRCQKASDVAGLTGERFASLLELRFAAPEFLGSLVVDEAASGDIVIAYTNGDNSVIEGPVTVTVSGEGAEGIEVASASNIQIGTGSGTIRLAVSGTPTTAGEVTFTVNGLDALGSDNSCTGKVIAPSAPEVGNFEAVFETTSLASDYATEMPVASNSNSGVSVSSCILTATADNISGTKWKSDIAAIGWDSNTDKLNPVQYFEMELKATSGTLALSGLDLEQRINGGDVVVSVQYSINGASYAECESRTLTSDDSSFTANLGKVAALTNLSAGSTVKIRIVATADKNATKWGVKAKGRLAIYGNVE